MVVEVYEIYDIKNHSLVSFVIKAPTPKASQNIDGSILPTTSWSLSTNCDQKVTNLTKNDHA